MLDRLGRKLQSNEGYLSGDYAAATDNLHSWVSNTIANAVSDRLKLSEIERKLFIASLTGHTIEGRKQTTGQLMGSITSFPVLCIANAAFTRWAKEIDLKRKVSLKDSTIMVNGDDVAMRCTKQGYRYWSKITKFGGLEESVGKTFFSRQFVQINSVNYLRDEDNPVDLVTSEKGKTIIRSCPFHEVKYVNMGLITGTKRSGGNIGLKDQSDSKTNLGTWYRELMKLCPNHLREDVHQHFINRHRKTLNKFQIPWYVPEWLGGWGLTGYTSPSELDLRVAGMILRNWETVRPISIAHQEASWKTWLMAEKRIPAFTVNQRSNPGVDAYTNLVSKICIDLLFDSDVDLEQLFVAPESKENFWIFQINEKIWLPSSYKALGPPIPKEHIEFQGKYQSLKEEKVISVDKALILD
jgi:hypothetical protein